MTGVIFKKDESALRHAEQKPRLSWGRDVWIALIGGSKFGPDEGKIISAYSIVALAVAVLIFRMWRRIKQYLNRA